MTSLVMVYDIPQEKFVSLVQRVKRLHLTRLVCHLYSLFQLYRQIIFRRPLDPISASPSQETSTQASRVVINHDSFVVEGHFGKGSYGTVYQIKTPALQVSVAYKEFANPDQQSAIRELYTIGTIAHPCIVSLLGVVIDPMQRIKGYLMKAAIATLGDFAKHCPSPADRSKPIAQLMDGLFQDLVDGLAFLHENAILHRDIKPANVLIIDGVAQLADMGLATYIPRSNGTVEACLNTGTVQTHQFRAPELWIADVLECYGPEVDIYALGVTALEMFLGNKESSVVGTRYKNLYRSNPPCDMIQSIIFDYRDDTDTTAEAILLPMLTHPTPGIRPPAVWIQRMWRKMRGAAKAIQSSILGNNTSGGQHLTLEQESTMTSLASWYDSSGRSDALATSIINQIRRDCRNDQYVDGSVNIATMITNYECLDLGVQGQDLLHLLICGKPRRRRISKRPRTSVSPISSPGNKWQRKQETRGTQARCNYRPIASKNSDKSPDVK